MADLGDLIPLGIKIRDADGVLTNASTVTLTITLPDGAVATPFVANPPTETGEYVSDYTPVQEGRHVVRWVSTGPAAAFTDSFDVRNSARRSIMSLDAAKKHLNIPLTSTVDDEELREFMEAATYAIERHRNEVIPVTTLADSDAVGSLALLDYHPVVRLISIASLTTVLDPLNWHVDRESGVLTKLNGPDLRQDMVITYEAGYRAIPAHYVLAAKIVLAHLWQTQRLATLGPTSGFGMRNQGSGQESILTPSGYGFALPPRAIELLGPRPPMIV